MSENLQNWIFGIVVIIILAGVLWSQWEENREKWRKYQTKKENEKILDSWRKTQE